MYLVDNIECGGASKPLNLTFLFIFTIFMCCAKLKQGLHTAALARCKSQYISF